MATRLNNVIYRDLPNPIYINEGNLQEYEVSISNGKILEKKNDFLIVLIDTSYQSTITIRK